MTEADGLDAKHPAHLKTLRKTHIDARNPNGTTRPFRSSM